jgi:PAS domain S-box-containing protein
VSIEQLLDSAPDGVVIFDSTGMIRLLNRQAEILFGYARDELLHQSVDVLLPERGRSDLDGLRRAFLQGATSRPIEAGRDIPVRCRDGSECLVDASFSVLETDDGPWLSAAVRDSADRRDLEARLDALEATSRLAAIVESSENAIIGKTLEGVIVSWNAASERMYGYNAEEIIGHNISELMANDRVHELASILERVTHGESIEHFETERVRKDGTPLEVSMTISPIRDAAGAVTGASSVARDMTETRRAQADRRALEAQLQQAQRLESIGQLAGGVAHDFNNLLAGIMNYASLVSTSLDEEMTKRGLAQDEAFVTLAQDVDEIMNVAKRAAALTHQLLIFSRRKVMHPEVLDLNAIISDMEKLLRTTIGENVDDLQIVLAEDLPLIKADRGQIDQVVMNLAVNARDAMPDGGRLEIETTVFEVDEQYADLRDIKPGTYARLTVSDTGTGMSQEVADHAFDPFFTTKAHGHGTGLGLATVYGIVTQAGGDVAIYSEVGLGTTIRVSLPATCDEASDPRAPNPEVPMAARGQTVLLVEDEEIVREPTRRILLKHGYTVLTARNSDDALYIVRAHSGAIDLLLTDVVMPGRSGKDLSVDVTALRPEIKVLFMSGYSQDVIVHQGVIDEGVSLIEKPFSADDLLRKIHDELLAHS